MTGWTATSAAARLGRAVGIRARWTTSYAAAHAAGRAARGHRSQGDTIFARGLVRNRARASAADAKALDVALAAMVTDRQVIERAVAAGAPLTAIAALTSAWARLPEDVRDVVRSPGGNGPGTVILGNVPATQVDQTTCGAAVMAMMLMMGDPLVAAWVMTSRSFGDYLPPEVVGIDGEMRTVEQRWHGLQRVLHHAVTRRGLGVAPWPQSLGTPPWGVARVARFGGVAFRSVVLDDAHAGTVTAAVAHAAAALRDGIPVPLYTSGDSHLGLATVVPRHVVLLVGRTDGGFLVYEPGTGRVVPLAEARLYGPGPREAAYGNWTRATWLILPRPKKSAP